jgi:hypothetical protein
MKNKIAFIGGLIAMVLIAIPIYYGTEQYEHGWTNLPGFLLLFTVITLYVWPDEKEEIKKEQKSDFKFSITTKFVDNTTGKTSDIFISGDDAEKLGNSISKFVQASTLLVNMNDEDLKEVAIHIKQEFEKSKQSKS